MGYGSALRVVTGRRPEPLAQKYFFSRAVEFETLFLVGLPHLHVMPVDQPLAAAMAVSSSAQTMGSKRWIWPSRPMM